MKKILKNTKLIFGLLFFLSLVIYFSFGFYHIGKFVTIDEHLWLYNRIPQYWEGISEKNWKLTYVHEKPGITLSLVSGLGLLKYENPYEYVKENHPRIANSTALMENFLTTFRIPLLLFNGIFSLFLFWIIKKITKNSWIALWSSILIFLSPILIGMTQIVNTDALLWTFSTATILSFVAYLKNMEKKFVFFTSLFLGLSLLSKFVSVILMPFIFAVEVFFCLNSFKKWTEEKSDIPKKIRDMSIAYLLIILGALLIFAILLPASFVKFSYLYKGTIGYPGMEMIMLPIFVIQSLVIIDNLVWKNKTTRVLLYFLQKFWDKFSKLIYLFLPLSFAIIIINYSFGNDFFKFENVPFDTLKTALFNKTSIIKKILLEFRPLVFSVTPLVLISLFYLWIKAIFQKKQNNFLSIILSFFIIVFTAGVIQQELLNIVRYSIVLYPLLSILAAIGINEFLSNKPRISRFFTTLVILIFSSYSLWAIKPFYLNYTNLLLPKKYIISDAWGYGGYEAAQYLNYLPNAKNIAIWSDRSGVCDFSVGKCIKSECKLPQNTEKFNYYVMTRRGKILHVKGATNYYDVRNKKDYMQCKKRPEIFGDILDKYNYKNEPVMEWLIDERSANYIKILKAND